MLPFRVFSRGRFLPWNWALKPLRRWLPSEVKCRRSQFLLLMTGEGRFMPVSLKERKTPRVNQQGNGPRHTRAKPLPGYALALAACAAWTHRGSHLRPTPGYVPGDEGSQTPDTDSPLRATQTRDTVFRVLLFHQNRNVMGSERENRQMTERAFPCLNPQPGFHRRRL